MGEKAGRPSIKARHRTPLKHVRTNVSHSHKLEVVKHFKEHDDMAATLAHFYPRMSDKARESRREQIYVWVNAESKLKDLCAKPGQKIKSRLDRWGSPPC